MLWHAERRFTAADFSQDENAADSAHGDASGTGTAKGGPRSSITDCKWNVPSSQLF